jgi:lysophospholipase L1-like esterase
MTGMKWLVWGAAAFGMALQASAEAPVAPSRTFASVNGTEIRCAPIVPPSAQQMADQFETRPQDLDALSAKVKALFETADPGAAAFKAKQAEQRANDWAYLCRYREANAALKESGRRPDVIFMGDSITEGWINAHPDFFAAHGYVDRGISGQSSSQMVVRFYADVVTLKPKVVHIMTGTNDIGGATGPITEDESVDNVRAMIDMARANKIKVVLASMPPMSRLLPRPDFDVRPHVLSLNKRLKALAAEKGVPFVDYYTPLATPDGAIDPKFANDGVHPTYVGYTLMEPLAEKALSRALAKK